MYCSILSENHIFQLLRGEVAVKHAAPCQRDGAGFLGNHNNIRIGNLACADGGSVPCAKLHTDLVAVRQGQKACSGSYAVAPHNHCAIMQWCIVFKNIDEQLTGNDIIVRLVP